MVNIFNTFFMKEKKLLIKSTDRGISSKERGRIFNSDNRYQTRVQAKLINAIQNSKKSQFANSHIQCRTATYTLLITGAENWAVTSDNAHLVVGYVSGAHIINERGLQGGGYVVVIQVNDTNIATVRSLTSGIGVHTVTVRSGNHIGDYH